jgi:phosphate transport system substrate-binding protein
MKLLAKYFILCLMAVSAFIYLPGCDSGGGRAVINGAGATFPYPIYSQWAHKYKNMHGVQLNYQSIGSGGGIAQIKAKTVDFGASDAPLKAKELDNHDMIQFPMVIGGVVPVVNIEGIAPGQIVLDAQMLSGIFLGTIKKWDDAALKLLNPDVALPAKDITVVHRADGSGTTWIFTNYLDKISEEWHTAVGTGKAVSWPTGVGGKGNEGVANYVKRVDGAIGYVEYAYALQNQMSHVMLVNREGNAVAPTIESFQAAAANADWANTPGYSVVLTDQPGKDSWPITGASFILIYKEQKNFETAKTVLSFFDWCYRHGAEMAQSLHYVPIPLNVVTIVEKTWHDEIKSGSKTVWEQ